MIQEVLPERRRSWGVVVVPCLLLCLQAVGDLPSVDQVIEERGWIQQEHLIDQSAKKQRGKPSDPLYLTKEAVAFKEYRQYVLSGASPAVLRDRSQDWVRQTREAAIKFLRVCWERNFRYRIHFIDSGNTSLLNRLQSEERKILEHFSQIHEPAEASIPLTDEERADFSKRLDELRGGQGSTDDQNLYVRWRKLTDVPHCAEQIKDAFEVATLLPTEIRKRVFAILLGSNVVPVSAVAKQVDPLDLLIVALGGIGGRHSGEIVGICVDRIAQRDPSILTPWILRSSNSQSTYNLRDLVPIVFDERYDASVAIIIAKSLANDGDFLKRLYGNDQPSQRLSDIQKAIAEYIRGNSGFRIGPGVRPDFTSLLHPGDKNEWRVQVALRLFKLQAIHTYDGRARIRGPIRSRLELQIKGFAAWRDGLDDPTYRQEADWILEKLEAAIGVAGFEYRDYLRDPFSRKLPPPPAEGAPEGSRDMWIVNRNRYLRAHIGHQLQELHKYVAKQVVAGQPFPKPLPEDLGTDPMVGKPSTYVPWKDQAQLTEEYVLAFGACKLQTGDEKDDADVVLLLGNAKIKSCRLADLPLTVQRINIKRAELGFSPIEVPALYPPPTQSPQPAGAKEKK